ncbi:hypothetical protein [Runella sp.]|uniref:hypothetical protein n=1 Tax=Runella sp. TaxID=1960881 RepID=UPI003D0A49B5
MSAKPLKWRFVFCWLWVLSTNSYDLFSQNELKTLQKSNRSASVLLKQYDSLASAYYISAETDKMYTSLHKGLTLGIQSRNERYQGIFLLHKALYLKRTKQLDSVTFYAYKAFSILQRYKEWKHVSRMMYLLGMIHLDKNDQVGALQQLIALIRFNEKHNEHTNTGSAYHLLSRTFHRLNDPLNEKKYILKHLALAEKQNSDYHRLYAFEAWAGFLTDQKQYNSAAVYFAKAYELVKRQNNEDATAGILITMGANFIAQKEYKKGLAALRSAEQIALKYIPEPGWVQTLATDYAYISSLFLSSGKPKKALEYARRSLALIEKKPLLYDYQIQGLKNQAAAQKALGLFREALNSYERLQVITQSIDIDKERETAKNIEAKYQFDKIEREKELSEKDLQIKELELQNQQKQRKLLSALLGLFAILLCGGLWLYQKKSSL